MPVDNVFTRTPHRPFKFTEQSAPPPPAPIPFTCFEFEVMDESVLRSVEAGPWPVAGVLRLNAPWLEPRTISHAGTAFLHLTPVDMQGDAMDLTSALYKAIVDDAGDDAQPEPSHEWATQAETWARPALARLPSSPLDRWRGERAARIAQVQDRLLRGFQLDPGTVQRITDTPVGSTRGLIPVGHDSARLAEAKRIAEEAAKVAETAAVARAVEDARPTTWREIGGQAIRCARERFGAVTSEPYPGAMLVDDDEKTMVYAWRTMPGLEIPAFDDPAGIATVDRDAPVPTLRLPLPEIDLNAVRFIREVRRRTMQIDASPIADFSDRGIKRARELVANGAIVFEKQLNETWSWRRGYLLEQIVRGCCVRPDIATQMVVEHLDRSFMGRQLPMTHPTQWTAQERALAGTPHAQPDRASVDIPTFTDRERPSRSQWKDIAQLAANAADTGEVNPGELLEDAPRDPPAPPPGFSAEIRQRVAGLGQRAEVVSTPASATVSQSDGGTHAGASAHVSKRSHSTK
jgi:hypothetical protein